MDVKLGIAKDFLLNIPNIMENKIVYVKFMSKNTYSEFSLIRRFINDVNTNLKEEGIDISFEISDNANVEIFINSDKISLLYPDIKTKGFLASATREDDKAIFFINMRLINRFKKKYFDESNYKEYILKHIVFHELGHILGMSDLVIYPEMTFASYDIEGERPSIMTHNNMYSTDIRNFNFNLDEVKYRKMDIDLLKKIIDNNFFTDKLK